MTTSRDAALKAAEWATKADAAAATASALLATGGAAPMTGRIPLGDLTSDQLDALYARIDTLEHVAAGNKRHVQLIVPDLERAEAAIERVRTLCEGEWYGITGNAFLAALDQPQQPTTTET